MEVPQLQACKLRFKVFAKDKRRFDIANITSVVEKFAVDGMVEYGMIRDDNYYYVRGSSCCFGGFDKQNPRCEMRITEVPLDDYPTFN